MLATATPDRGRLPHGLQWVYEVKWDGMRILADTAAGPDHDRLRLSSRTGRDVTGTFPELAVLEGLPDVVLDGEVVAFDPDGVPSFPVLAERLGVTQRRRAEALARRVPVTYLVFDVLRHEGVDLTGCTLDERRAVLDGLVLPDGPVSVSPLYDDGDVLLAATRERGLEGVVAKRRDSRYESGRRSRHWVKAAHWLERTVLVGGWRPQVDTTDRVGAVLVGAPDDEGGLHYLGRVGSGIAATAQADLRRLLAPLATQSSPFAEAVPALDARGAHWVEPGVVVSVRHLGWTNGQRLRQPSYRGIRRDGAPDPLPRKPTAATS